MPFGQNKLSPCIRHCCLDENDVCLGCRRTLTEILGWQQLSDAQKHSLMDELKQRRQQGPSHFPPKPPA